MLTSLRLALSRDDLRTIVAVLDAPTASFVALARLTGLDPARDFRGADLSGVRFGSEDDLSGFDFSAADLSGTVGLSRACGLDRIVTDAATRLPADLRLPPPPDFDLEKAKELILAGIAPPVSWRPFITELDFRDTGLADLSPLAGPTALHSLVLWDTLVSDLAPLAGLTALRTLGLAGTAVGDLAPLAGLTALRTLGLAGTAVGDLAPLAGLTALQTLVLWHTPVSDVSPLAGLTALQSLDLGFTLVGDLSPLAGLTALQSLTLGFTRVGDLSPLSGLTALQSLDLRRTRGRLTRLPAGLVRQGRSRLFERPAA